MEYNNLKTVYIKRRNHQSLNESEIDQLSDSMKELRKGKLVFWSKIDIKHEEPINEFINKTFANKRRKRGLSGWFQTLD